MKAFHALSFPLAFLIALSGCTKTTFVEGLDQPASPPVTPPSSSKFSKAVDVGSVTVTNVWKSNFTWKVEKYQVPSITNYYLAFTSGNSTNLLVVDQHSNTVFLTSAQADLAGNHPTWLLEYFAAPNIYRIRNIDTQGYLNVESGSLTTGDILPGWLSAQWTIK